MFMYSFFGCFIITALEKTHHCMQIVLTQVHGVPLAQMDRFINETSVLLPSTLLQITRNTVLK